MKKTLFLTCLCTGHMWAINDSVSTGFLCDKENLEAPAFIEQDCPKTLNCSKPVTVAWQSEPYGIKIGIDEKGEVNLLWLNDLQRNERLFAITRDSQKNWSLPELLCEGHTHISSPKIFSGKDQIFAVWEAEKEVKGTFFPECFYQYAKKGPKGWSIPTDLIDSISCNSLTLDKENNFIFLNQNPHNKNITAIYLNPLTGEKKEETLSDSSIIPDKIKNKIVRNEKGDVFSIWTDFSWGIWPIFSSYVYLVGAELSENGFLPQMIVGDEGHQGFFSPKKTAMNNQGTIAILGIQRLNSYEIGRILMFYKGNWMYTEIPYFPLKNTKISLDEKDNLLIAWEYKNRVLAMYKPAGKPWLPYKALSNPQLHSQHLTLKQDDLGHFIVVWVEKQTLKKSINGAVLNTKDQTWSSSSPLSPEDISCERPKLAFKNGTGVITWLAEDSGGINRIQVAHLFIESLPIPFEPESSEIDGIEISEISLDP